MMTGFYQLDTGDQVARLEQLALEVLSEWELDVDHLELIKYRENAVFKLFTTRGTPYALRIHRAGYHTDDELRSELQWMEALAVSGIHVPTLVPTRTGQPFKAVVTDDPRESRQIDVFEWVGGAQLGAVEEGVSDPAAVAETYHINGSLAAQ
jgi:Ser/Thr protein kinase RdoA (MazF antagonist)